jgi:hypothetical protein
MHVNNLYMNKKILKAVQTILKANEEGSVQMC